MNEHSTDPQQQPLFAERVSIDAVFPGYRQWLEKQQRHCYPRNVHPSERGLYDAWCDAVTPRAASEQKEGRD